MPGPLPIVVLSPHLDDAVLSCGETLALHPGSHVLTLFAGMPAEAEQLTAWDRACGFASARQAIAARRAEDTAALALLQATPQWLDHGDRQYGASPSTAMLAVSVAERLAMLGAATVLAPLGLFHSDHELAHDAAVRLLRSTRRTEAWLAYEDVPYRRQPGLLQRRLALLREAGVQATPCVAPRGHPLLKARALACYASQMRQLGAAANADAQAPEGLWQLAVHP